MISIKEATSRKDIKKFVTFPFSLYKDNKYWVPPIINDEIASFDPAKNPVFEDAEARYFLAYAGSKIVGRIAAIINRIEIEDQKVRKMRFGWFDFIDDIAVSTLLLAKVETIGKEHQLDFMEGPVGFSNLDKVGVLTYGFDHIGTMITWYNHAYYQDHFKELGFKVEKEYLENKFPAKNAAPQFFHRVNELIKKRYKLRPLNFTKTKDVMPWADKMFDLFNESYASLSSFVPITDIQKQYFKKKYISFINPEYIKFVVDAEDTLVAFAIVMPSFSEALQKSKGNLLPFGFLHLLKAKKESKDVIFYLIGIHPTYKNKGVTAILFNEYHETFEEKNIDMCYRTPELADNKAIHLLWKHFEPVIYKKRCTFRKELV